MNGFGFCIVLLMWISFVCCIARAMYNNWTGRNANLILVSFFAVTGIVLLSSPPLSILDTSDQYQVWALESDWCARIVHRMYVTNITIQEMRASVLCDDAPWEIDSTTTADVWDLFRGNFDMNEFHANAATNSDGGTLYFSVSAPAASDGIVQAAVDRLRQAMPRHCRWENHPVPHQHYTLLYRTPICPAFADSELLYALWVLLAVFFGVFDGQAFAVFCVTAYISHSILTSVS